MNGPSQAKHALSIVAAATTTKQYQSLLHRYAASKSLTKTKQLHAIITTGGRLSGHLRSTLAVAYALLGVIPHTRKLFDELPERSLLLYNTVLRMYVNGGRYYDAIDVFVGMVGETGRCCPDGYTYPFVIKACGELRSGSLGKVIHGQALRGGFDGNVFVINSVLAMYMNCGEVKAARNVFDGMEERTVVSWNTMISGYFRNGCLNEALVFFYRMVDLGIEPDSATMVSVLPVCGCLKDLDTGREVHMMVEEKGLAKKIEVRNALVDMYVKCGCMDEAQFVFDRMVERDVVTWTSMINGYILNGDVEKALGLCRSMQFEGVRPNSLTLASLLSACGSVIKLNDGKCLHGLAIRQKLDSDVIIETALINMYAKCNRIQLSFQVFTRTSKKRTAPWNAIFCGYVHNKLATEAIELFKQMKTEAAEPDFATLNSILPAYAIVADMHQAMDIHCYLTKSGFISSLEVVTGLIDIYSKCGCLESGHRVFNGIPEKDKCKDIILWTVLIAGYGMHGDGENSILLFKQMIQSGVKPNEVTFTSVLHSCSHAGMVDAGLSLFNYMLENHSTMARPNHYTCIVDLLGRAGRLNEAYNLIRTMPFTPSPTVWGALLGACVIHENVELGEVAATQLFELEPGNTGNYVLLAKIYAALGRWKDVENVRNKMNDIGLIKAPAHSLIEARSTLN